MIQDSINRISYDGNGIATEFAYPFTIITISDIKVMIVDTDGTETVLTNDYYVDEVNSKVDYPGYPEGEEPLPENQPPILATGQKIVIYRELSVTQLTSLFDQYPFKTTEAMIDKTTILLQQLKDAQERALTLSVSTDTAVSLILPAPSALKSFRWNASANKLELTADPATVLASVQGYAEITEGYATSANEDAETATTGANTATSQAEIATQAAATMALATQAEAEAGTDNIKRMSPLRTLQEILANIATQAEAEGGTDNTKLMTSLRTLQLLTAKLATEEEAEAGIDDTKLMTPLKVAQAIDALVTVVPHGHAYFTASGTWHCPAGVTEVIINACAGGGAGYDVSTGTSGGNTSFGTLLTLVGGWYGSYNSTTGIYSNGADGSLLNGLFGGKGASSNSPIGYGAGGRGSASGGNGACVHESPYAVTPGTSYTITIGAGGINSSLTTRNGTGGMLLIQW